MLGKCFQYSAAPILETAGLDLETAGLDGPLVKSARVIYDLPEWHIQKLYSRASYLHWKGKTIF